MNPVGPGKMLPWAARRHALVLPLRRAFPVWIVCRGSVLLVSLLLYGEMPTRVAGFIPMAAVIALLTVVDIERRHERYLLANLGTGRALTAFLAAAASLAADGVLARLVEVTR